MAATADPVVTGWSRSPWCHTPFLNDIETQIRFLIALPILIAAELIVHLRLRPVVQSFVIRDIVSAKEMPQFHEAIKSAIQWRDSIRLEFGLLIFVYAVGPWLWRSQIALDASTWYAIPESGHLRLTPPGYWIAFVSIPIFQFILLRWYLRLFIWFRFLWQASRLNLNIIPTHPDRAGGLAFLGVASYAFAPILFAQGAMLAGLIANRVLYAGESLLSFKMEAVGLIAVFMLAILGPLTVFTPKLSRAKRKGFADYGLLASRYVEEFEHKWVKGRGLLSHELLGNVDIQSLADLGHSYAVIGEMRAVPFGIRDMMLLAAATAAPLIPLGLIIFSLEELLMRLLKVIFYELSSPFGPERTHSGFVLLETRGDDSHCIPASRPRSLAKPRSSSRTTESITAPITTGAENADRRTNRAVMPDRPGPSSVTTRARLPGCRVLSWFGWTPNNSSQADRMTTKGCWESTVSPRLGPF